MTTVHSDQLFAELARLSTTLPANSTFITLLQAVLDPRYGLFSSGAGAPGGTGSNGEQYYDTTNDRLYLSDGVGWIVMYEPLQTFTPTASWTVGNGTWVANFRRSAGLCDMSAAFTFGTTSAIAGSTSFGLPKAASALAAQKFAGGFDIAGEFYTATSAAVAAAGTTVVLRAIDTAATYARFANTSGTIPASFATGSKISCSGIYSMNTPYL